jgi:hypothetical protein
MRTKADVRLRRAINLQQVSALGQRGAGRKQVIA